MRAVDLAACRRAAAADVCQVVVKRQLLSQALEWVAGMADIVAKGLKVQASMSPV